MNRAPLAAVDSPVLWVNRGLELLWLLTIVLVPLAAFGRTNGEWSSIIGSFELPKIGLLRTLTSLMAALWLIEWALRRNSQIGTPSDSHHAILQPELWLSGLRSWLAAEHTRWLCLGVTLFLGSVILSALLSASFWVSMWGDIPGQDSYSAYTVVSYVFLFGIIATHLKSRGQLWRLIGAVVLTGVLVSAYGVLQHYGHDFLDLVEPPGATRVSSTLGNPLFAGSLLLMTIPISLIVGTVALRAPFSAPRLWWQLALWVSILTIQLLALVFTLSRGSWSGEALALVSIIGMTIAFVGRRSSVRMISLLGLAALIVLAVVLIQPRLAGQDAGETKSTAAADPAIVTERASSIANPLSGGGLSGRIDIWKASWSLMVQRPWPEFDNVGISALRPLVGYGPDLFRYTYLLESPPNTGQMLLPNEVAHAHNYFLHQGVELGFLGLMTSVVVFGSLFISGGYLLIRKRHEGSELSKLLLIGLLGAMGGRLLEQLVGVARVSDLVLFWVLLAVFASIPTVTRLSPAQPGDEGQGSSRRQPAHSPRGQRGNVGYWNRQHIVRLVVVAGLIAGIGAVTWLKTINYSRAAFAADQGAEQFRQGDFSGAISSLDRAIQISSDVSSYRDRWVSVNRERSDDDAALAVECRATEPARERSICVAGADYAQAQQWIENRPLDFRSRLALANAALGLGLLKDDAGLKSESVRLYQEVLQLTPNSWTVWNLLARVQIDLDHPQRAMPPLEQSLLITGDSSWSSEAFALRGLALQGQGETKLAIDDLNKSIGLDPWFHEPHYFRGRVFYEIGDSQSAIEDMDRAIERHPSYVDAFYLRGKAHSTQGQPEKAIEDFDEALRLEPRHSEAYNDRGLAYTALGQYQRAIDDFNQAILSNHEFALAYNNRGFSLRLLGRFSSAIEDLDQAIALDPEFAMAYFNRALAFSMLDKEVEAQRDGRRAIELGFDPVLLGNAFDKLKAAR